MLVVYRANSLLELRTRRSSINYNCCLLSFLHQKFVILLFSALKKPESNEQEKLSVYFEKAGRCGPQKSKKKLKSGTL